MPTDAQGRLIEAAEKYAEAYSEDDRQDIQVDVKNAYYAGAAYHACTLAQARAEEREACAKVCAEPEPREDYVGGKTWVECASAIRARKD